MLAQGSGNIIDIASVGSSIVDPNTTAYLPSKGAVPQMTRSLALGWIPRGVRVNVIAPMLFDSAPCAPLIPKLRPRTIS